MYIRVVSATNLDVEGKVKKGEFREDLYFRLNMISIYIPHGKRGREGDEDQQELMRFITFFRFSKGWKRCTEDG